MAWSTGADTFYGLEVLKEVFDDGLWAMQPSLTVLELLADDGRAAVQMTEVLTIEGEQRRFAIACFFTVRRPHPEGEGVSRGQRRHRLI